MSRLEDTKARLERVLGQFEVIALRMQALQTDNQSLQNELNKSQEREAVLRLAAYDALTEVDQAIAVIAKQTSIEREPIENKETLEFTELPTPNPEVEKSVPVDSIIGSDDLNTVSIAQSLQPESEEDIDFIDSIESVVTDDHIDAAEAEAEYQTADLHRNIEDTIGEKPTDQNDAKRESTSGGSWSYLDD